MGYIVNMHLDLKNWVLKTWNLEVHTSFSWENTDFSRLPSWKANFLLFFVFVFFGCQKSTSQKWYLEVRSSFSWGNTDFFKITILKSQKSIVHRFKLREFIWGNADGRKFFHIRLRLDLILGQQIMKILNIKKQHQKTKLCI